MPKSMYADPRGGRLSALERNILKYRAFEMVLVLYHAQALRDFVLSHVEVRDETTKRLGKSPIVKSDKKQFEQAIEGLVSHGLLAQDEAAEIEKLVNHRNNVAHRVHHLTADISRSRQARSYIDWKGIAYDYKVRERLKFYRQELPDRVSRASWRHVIGFDDFLFDAAEKIYEDEIKRLRKKLDRQIPCYREAIRALEKDVSLAGTEFTEDFYPDHPEDKTRDGRLTKRGVEVCYRLFDLGKSPLAVAYLIHITHTSSINRHKAWKAAGGRRRTKLEIHPDR